MLIPMLPKSSPDLPPDVSVGSVEIVMDGSYTPPGSPHLFEGDDYYEKIEAYRIGAMAVHRDILFNMVAGSNWAVTHAATGVTIWLGLTLKQAAEVARFADKAANWSAVTRGEFPRYPDGWSDLIKAAIKKIDRKFPGTVFPEGTISGGE